MSANKPVVVYGASGYTGRLVCEYLREFHVPFIAAGRDKARLQEGIEKIPGYAGICDQTAAVPARRGRRVRW